MTSVNLDLSGNLCYLLQPFKYEKGAWNTVTTYELNFAKQHDVIKFIYLKYPQNIQQF